MATTIRFEMNPTTNQNLEITNRKSFSPIQNPLKIRPFVRTILQVHYRSLQQTLFAGIISIKTLTFNEFSQQV